ncbi:MAG TPA: surface-adhesin E family protein [Burkholderiales bacterium]|nr:surface-adhesin E family protein [Burkholderiales bacterium]
MAASVNSVLRNVAIGILLAAVSAGALAEVWIETSRNDDYLAYADPSSIRRDGDLVKMWSMFDYRNPQPGIPGKTYLSARRQFEYDCKRARTRALAISSHAAREGKGDALASASVKYDWRAVVPDSADDYLLKFACKKFDGK